MTYDNYPDSAYGILFNKTIPKICCYHRTRFAMLAVGSTKPTAAQIKNYLLILQTIGVGTCLNLDEIFVVI